MKIGIDIDDTLTDVKDKLYEAGVDFTRKIGKIGDFKRIEKDDPKSDGGIFKEMFGFTDDELKIQEK